MFNTLGCNCFKLWQAFLPFQPANLKYSNVFYDEEQFWCYRNTDLLHEKELKKELTETFVHLNTEP